MLHFDQNTEKNCSEDKPAMHNEKEHTGPIFNITSAMLTLFPNILLDTWREFMVQEREK